MRRNILTLLAVCLFLGSSSPVFAADFREICPNVLKGWIFDRKPLVIVDAQPVDEFARHNYEGSVSVAGDPSTLGALARRYAATDEEVVVVASEGGSKAREVAELLVGQGISAARVLILEGGMLGALAASTLCDCCKTGAEGR